MYTNKDLWGEIMRVYLNIDNDGYLLSVAKIGGGIEAEIDLDKYDLSGDRINAHKWGNNTLTFDADKYAEIEAEKAAAETLQEQPTAFEQLRADIDYIAIMTGVEL